MFRFVNILVEIPQVAVFFFLNVRCETEKVYNCAVQLIATNIDVCPRVFV